MRALAEKARVAAGAQSQLTLTEGEDGPASRVLA